MKIKELTNAPQWLLDAFVRDEDVTINDRGRVVWHSGSWDRGEFLGGEFRGGYFLGGYFRGGEFRGGEFLGGDFRGGEFLGGEFRGEKLTKAPLVLAGLRWPVLITDTRMQIGCQLHRVTEWRAFDDAAIAAMDGRDALRFWRAHKVALLALCER